MRSTSRYRRPPPHRLVAVELLLEYALASGEVRQLSLELVQPSCDEPRLELGQVSSGSLGEQLRTPPGDYALHGGGVIGRHLQQHGVQVVAPSLSPRSPRVRESSTTRMPPRSSSWPTPRATRPACARASTIETFSDALTRCAPARLIT